jgi:magnesium-protoporphyrin IX monomethyl ester (oxidative) cyclase
MGEHTSYDVVLAVLPWAPIDAPSIQLGLLKAVLDREGISTRTAHLNVEFYKFLQAAAKTSKTLRVPGAPHLFDAIREISAASSWIFAIPPVFENIKTIDDHLAQIKKNGIEDETDNLENIELAEQVRKLVPAFLEQCAAEILESKPKVVGFSCTFAQRTPSLVLGKILKMKDPGLKIVFGGTYMDGIMGEAFIKTFPWVDAVVRGDGERVVAPLFRQLCANEPIKAQPGLCIRKGKQVKIHPEAPKSMTILKEAPVPSYDEYFQRTADTPISIPGTIRVSVETSRGCWWFKNKCKFCGRSEESIRYRTKPVEQVAHELRALSQRHGVLDFTMVDPCAQSKFMVNLMSGLKKQGLDFRAWCQTRVKFKKEQMQTLGRSGVDTILVGIESLSTPVLELMRKGHTALEAVQVLKWGLEYGITITWNMIYGFPGEKSQHYEQMADLMKSLFHLNPAFQLSSLVLNRSAEYFDQAETYGIELIAPRHLQDPLYYLAHQLGEEKRMEGLAGGLSGKYQRIDPEVVEQCQKILAEWRKDHPKNYGRLWYRRGAGFIKILDYRSNVEHQVYTLDDLEAKIYLACDSAASVGTVWEGLTNEEKSQLSRDEIKEFLDELVKNRLACEENGRFLSLAVSEEGMMRAKGKLQGFAAT